jgi:DNA-binding GntR family transcriptional regulator
MPAVDLAEVSLPACTWRRSRLATIATLTIIGGTIRSSTHSRSRGHGVYGELRRQIVLNERAPGAVLTELALAADLSSSQSVIREALIRLEGDGLVVRSGYQGTVVTDLDAEEAAEILALRKRMETRAARRVCRRVNGGDISALTGQLTEMRRAATAEDLGALVSADTDFHLALFRISGLLAMEPILARCILHTHRFRAWAPWHRRPMMQTADRHVPILDALAARDATALHQELATHLDTIVEMKPT